MASFKNLISTTSAQISSGGTITGDLVVDGDLTVNGGGSLSFDEIVEGTQVIDITSTEAFLVRKNGDGGDLFVADTTNMRVGINKSSPTGVLHISAPSGSAPTMFFEQYTSATDGTLGEISFGNRAVDGQLALIQAKNDGANDSAFLAFHTEVTSGALTERMRITSSGNTGIGEDTPLSTLVVRGANAVNPSNGSGGNHTLQVIDTTSIAQGVGGGIAFGGNFVGSTETLFAEIRGIKENATSHDFDGALVFSTRLEDASIAESMRISSDGKVGIGTGANIDELLHIQASSGNVYAKVEAEASNSSAGLRLVGGDNDESRIHFGNSSDVDIGKIVYLHGSTNAMVFTTNTSEKMRIESGGDILIKTADAKIKADSTNTLNIQAHHLKILGSGGEERFHFQSEGNSNPSEFSMKGDTENTMIKLNTNGDSFIHGKTNSAVSFNITSFSTNSGKIPRLRLRHSNSNTVGTDTAVDSGDDLGEVAFQGYDGSSEYNTGASISAKAGATFTTSEAQSELIFNVASGSQNPAEKLRLSHDGILFVGGFSGLATPELAIKSNTTGNGLVNVVSFRDSNNTQQGYLGYGSTSHSNLNLLTLLGGLNFYAGSTNIRFALDDNSRISLSNNDASGAVGTTLFGKSAGLNIVSGAVDNTFIGHEVAAAGTMTSAADSNTGVGFKALSPLTSGTFNTMVGYRSGFNINTGSNNTALGGDSLKNCNDGTFNVAIGRSANEANAGDYNVAVGAYSLEDNTASNNTAVGYLSSKNVTTGTSNTALGYSSLGGNVTTALTGNDNIALGANAGRDIQGSAEANTLIGKDSGIALTTGNFNVLIGRDAGDSLVDETHNTAIGTDALGGSSLVDQTVIIGSQAGAGAMTADADGTVCVGYESGSAITSGSGAIAVGFQALKSLTEGDNNVAIGYGALDEITTGCCNIAIGTNALGNCDGGENENIAIGNNAGLNLDNGHNNTIVGANANASSGTANGQIIIGKDVTGSAGNSSATLGLSTNKVSIDLDGSDTSWAASSDERLKENIQTSTAGLSFINELRPVTFNWKKAKDVDKSMSQYQDSEEPALGLEGSYGKTMHGFIAQEVKSAIDKHSDLKEGFSMWKEWEDGTQAVSDGALVPVLVKAIQELSARVEELESK